MDQLLLFLFRLSQKIEPGTSTPRANASKEDLAGELGILKAELNLFFHLFAFHTTWYINLHFLLNSHLKARRRQRLLSAAANVQ